MSSSKIFNEFKKKLMNANIEAVNGSIFDMDRFLGEEKFDRIMFSNVLGYLTTFAGDSDLKEFLLNNFKSWVNHLNDDGILQLLYLYNCSIIDFSLLYSKIFPPNS